MKTFKWRRVPAATQQTAESAALVNVAIKQHEPSRAGNQPLCLAQPLGPAFHLQAHALLLRKLRLMFGPCCAAVPFNKRIHYQKTVINEGKNGSTAMEAKGRKFLPRRRHDVSQVTSVNVMV